jgi:hypothetical protein
MSQRWIITPTHNIFVGWDRMLQYHFLCAYERDVDGNERTVYNNLEDSRNVTGSYAGCRGMTLDQVVERMNELNLPLPCRVHKLLQEDQVSNIGNHVSYHNTEGQEVPRVAAV